MGVGVGRGSVGVGSGELQPARTSSAATMRASRASRPLTLLEHIVGAALVPNLEQDPAADQMAQVQPQRLG